MENIGFLGLLIAGTVVFVILNKIFDIAYFGFKGMFVTWMGCVIITFFAGAFILSLIIEYYKWILGAIGVIALLVFLVKKGKQLDEAPSAEGSNEEKSVSKTDGI